LASSPIEAWNFVARITSSRRPPASALPTISSDSPAEYTSAVSMKLMPPSSAAWMMRDALGVIGLAPGAEHHGAEAEGADLHAGTTERASLHGPVAARAA
jgi:hypothetical protein